MTRFLTFVFATALLGVAGGCNCCCLMDRYGDHVDDIGQCHPELDCLYHPAYDLSRIGMPDWCACPINRILGGCACDCQECCCPICGRCGTHCCTGPGAPGYGPYFIPGAGVGPHATPPDAQTVTPGGDAEEVAPPPQPAAPGTDPFQMPETRPETSNPSEPTPTFEMPGPAPSTESTPPATEGAAGPIHAPVPELPTE